MVDGEGTIYISMEDYVNFLIEKSGLPKGAMFSFGKPRIQNEELEVPYAFSTTEVHPSEWIKKPSFMEEENMK